MKTIDITRISDGKRTRVDDPVANEVLVSVFLNEMQIATFSCLGTNLNELIIGYLYFHDYISDHNEITSMDYGVNDNKVYVSVTRDEYNLDNQPESSPKPYNHKMLLELMATFAASSETFQKTGAVHSAAIATENKLLTAFEDLSRHNTLFMLLGYSLINNQPLSDKILLLTCRLTQSIMALIQKTRVKTILTKAAPTAYAVQQCKENNITMAGFVRKNRMNIYHGSERIH